MSTYTAVKAKLYLSKDIEENIKQWLFIQTIDICKYSDDEYWDLLEKYRPEELKNSYNSFNLNDSKNELYETKHYYVLELDFETKNKNNFIQNLITLLKPYITNCGVIGTLHSDTFDVPGNITFANGILSFDLGSFRYD